MSRARRRLEEKKPAEKKRPLNRAAKEAERGAANEAGQRHGGLEETTTRARQRDGREKKEAALQRGDGPRESQGDPNATIRRAVTGTHRGFLGQSRHT